MDKKPETSVREFISRTPTLKILPTGVALWVAQLGQKQYRLEEDGSFTLTDTSYIEMVMLGNRAEAAAKEFTKGDDVVAISEMRPRKCSYQGRRYERV